MFSVYDYLVDHGVEVVREDGMELACYCPFHANADTPAFYINKRTGLWICFNPGCGKRGSMRDLMEFFGDQKPFSKEVDLEDIIAELNHKEVEIDEGWDNTLEKIIIKFPEERNKAAYLINRGFEDSTLEYFEVGYSETKARLVVPVRNEHHKTIGFIGRAISDNIQPKYLYSKGFPRKDVLFNLNNAKKYDWVVVVEGSLDAMMIHQAGIPNVVATLGAAVTTEHCHLLNRYFDKIVCFSDNDHAGYVMRDLLVASCGHKELRIVEYPSDDMHDPGSMTKEEIVTAITKARDYFAWLMNL